MLLALDTSTLTLSLALLERRPEGLLLVEEVAIPPPRKQSELLPHELFALLGRHGLELSSLTGLVVGLGPGSFTGLRIGVATAKALAYAAQLPLTGASSLAAAALSGPEGAPLWSLAVARHDELYLGRYRRQGDTVEPEGEETALSVKELAKEAGEVPEALLLGPGAVEYRDRLLAAGVPEPRLLSVAPHPRAAHVARLAPVAERFDLKAVFDLEPHYVRASEAERNPNFPPLPGPAPTARLKE